MSTRFRRIVFLAVGIGLLFGAATGLRPLQGMRQKYDLSSEPVTGLSPGLALATQVLGWGRGLIIDVIWIRMETLKQEDRFFELVQLADWACKLAPRFPQVWDIQSWNLAYNVSCKVPLLDDRWAWIQAGITLLRDQGIPENPYSVMLYDRLAWIFFHKIGEQSDSAHMFYKIQFGLMMHEALGGEGNHATLERLAGAPRTREQLLKDPEVKSLVDKVAKATGFDLIDGFFELYRRTESVPPETYDIVNQPDNLQAMYRVAFFARARRLREEFKMDPNTMIEVMNRFKDEDGNPIEVPFDWRTPYPHAIYWAHVGLQKLAELEARTRPEARERYEERKRRHGDALEEDEGIYEFRRITLDRVIYASMQSLVHHGRLLFDTKGQLMMEFGPDYRFADATLPLYTQVMEVHGARFRMGTKTALMNFLRRGVAEFYLSQQMSRAQDYYNRLRKDFDYVVKGTDTVEQFVNRELAREGEDMTNSEAKLRVRNYIQRSLFALGCNQDDVAVHYEQLALRFVKKWNGDTVKRDFRDTIFYDKLRESVVVDILTGKVPFPPDILYNLRSRLADESGAGGDVIARQVLKNLADQGKLPEVEQVADKWKFSPY